MLKINKWACCIVIGFCYLFLLHASAQQTQIDLIFDASGSMWGQIDGVSKIEIARDALQDLLKQLEEHSDTQLALRVYGHKNKECSNSLIVVPMGADNSSQINSFVQSIKPLGRTPIAYSLEQSVNDFIQKETGEKIILLITDGLESCDGDICAVAKSLKEAGVITQIHVVGFGLKKSELSSLECLTAPFGGVLAGADNKSQLIQAFEKVAKNTTRHNLEIRAFDDNKNSVFINYTISDQYATPVVSGDNSMDQVGKESLKPGMYTIKIINSQSGDEIRLANIEIQKEGIVKKEVIFAERAISISVKDSLGNNKMVDVYVYDESGEQIKMADTSMGGTAEFTVLPGIYSVKVDDYRNNRQVQLKDINLVENKSYKKTITME